MTFSTKKLEPRTKILIMIICGFLVILLDSPSALLVSFVASIFLFAFSLPNLREIRLLLIFLIFTTWGLIYSQSIFYNEFPRTVLVTLIPIEFPIFGKITGGIRVYREGIFHGILQSLRFNTTLVIGCYIVWTTQTRDLLLALMKLRIPSALAFMVTTALRFIPSIANETSAIIRSQRLRGFRYFRLNLLASTRGIINCFRPILAGIIRQATHLGESVESRGFSTEITADRTSLQNLRMRLWDYSILAILSLSLISVIGLKIIYFCYENGLFYATWLRYAYTFTREIL